MKQIISTSLAGILLAILISTLSVNGQANGASIQGTITDSSSAVIPGVKVTATNRDTKTSSSTISDANGKYAFSGLNDGEYVFSASLQGFSTTEVNRPIAKDSAVEQNLVLKVGQVDATVRVVPVPSQPQDQGMVIRPNGNYR